MGLGYNDFKEQTKDTVVDFDGSLDEKADPEDLKAMQAEAAHQRSWSKRKPSKNKKNCS